MKRKNRDRFNCDERKEGKKVRKYFASPNCRCSREAYQAGWEDCHLVCDYLEGLGNIDIFTHCECTKDNAAGLFCERQACWHKGSRKLLCMHPHYRPDLECSHVSKSRRHDSYPECKCHGGRMKSDGNCECQSDYRGLLCNEWVEPPPPKPDPPQDPRPSPRSYTPRLPPPTDPLTPDKPRTSEPGMDTGVLITLVTVVPLVIMVLIIGLVFLSVYCCQRRVKRTERLAPWIPPGASPMPGQENRPIFGGEPIGNEPWTPPIDRNVGTSAEFESDQPRPIASSPATPISGQWSRSKRKK